jgi:O-antigen biosynthesis protein
VKSAYKAYLSYYYRLYMQASFYVNFSKWYFNTAILMGKNYAPFSEPTEKLLLSWSRSDRPVYQDWLNKHALTSLSEWRIQRKTSLSWPNEPIITIVIPVHNVSGWMLYETVLSVLQQSHPFWQLCLVDDGSKAYETHITLKSFLTNDPRINVVYLQESVGISEATNVGIANAKGEFVVFLDHDDRLTHDALYRVAKAIHEERQAPDIIYSDRDVISPSGFRYKHLLKPEWSPETLLSGNYAFHLICYRREFLMQLGGYRKEYDGSQDYDLLLRAAEKTTNVIHLPYVLYGWREHDVSIAKNDKAKEYVFQAGQNALRDALRRRGLNGAVNEIEDAWRGNYQITFAPVPKNKILIINSIQDNGVVSEKLQESKEIDFVVIVNPNLNVESYEAIEKLVSPLILDKVGVVTGKILDLNGAIFHAGLAYKMPAGLIPLYRGFSVSEPGYMAMTMILRNVILPHPWCIAFRREVYELINSIDKSLSFESILLLTALEAYKQGWRCVYQPQAIFHQIKKKDNEFGLFVEYKDFLLACNKVFVNGDPYLHPELKCENNGVGIFNS